MHANSNAADQSDQHLWFQYLRSRVSKLSTCILARVKSGIFGQTAKFGQRSCLFHISNIEINNKLTNQTEKILIRRLIRSRLTWIYTVCKCVSEFTRCQKLPDFTLIFAAEQTVDAQARHSVVK